MALSFFLGSADQAGCPCYVTTESSASNGIAVTPPVYDGRPHETAALTASYHSALDAALAAVCAMGVCGERAHARLKPGEGNASCRNHLIDAVYALTPQDLEREARYAVYG